MGDVIEHEGVHQEIEIFYVVTIIILKIRKENTRQETQTHIVISNGNFYSTLWIRNMDRIETHSSKIEASEMKYKGEDG